ncbi:MAG: site-specific integrase [Pseudomonadota bacterium]
MNLTLKHAAALDLDVDLQAIMKMKALLGKRRHEAKHIPSLPYQDAPAFYQVLVNSDTTTARALRFLMLTAARSGEVRFATAHEIKDDIWELSEERTKTGKLMRFPLSSEAIRLIENSKRQSSAEFLFPSPNGGVLSENAMSTFMKRQNMTARPHGLRATFRTWAENETDADWETKESALGHTVGNSVERAYQRSDRVNKRRRLMEAWGALLTGKKA